MTLTVFLGACETSRMIQSGAVQGPDLAPALPATVRFLRVVPDERAAALDAASVRLVVHASLASIVFASQGEPPTVGRSGKSNRGFASMSPERQREIASKGGRAAHEKGTAILTRSH